MSNWKRARIGDLCKIIKGETGLASASPGAYPLVATGADRKSCTTWQFDTDAVCIPLVSSTGHGKKTLNYVHYQSGKFALGTILAAVIPKDPSVLTARFLHLYLSHFKDTVLVPLMKGAANVSLSMKEIATVEIPVPPLDEQQSLINLIFRIEDEHQELLTETNRQGDLLKQLRQALLQEAAEGKLTTAWRKQHPVAKGDPQYDAMALLAQIKAEKERLVKEGKIRKEKPLSPVADADKLFELPDGWVWCSLGELCSKITDGTHQTPTYVEHGRMFLSAQNIKPFRFMPEIHKFVSEQAFQDCIKNRKPELGDVLVARVGAGIGEAAVIDQDIEFAFYVSLGLVKPIHKALYNKFLAMLFNSPMGVAYSKGNIASGGTSAGNFNLEKIRTFPIPLAPLAEQQAIVARVDSLMAVIDELEKQVAERKGQTRLLMQTVLREAFMAKYQVKTWREHA